MSCFADWSKRLHVTLSIIICSPLHGHVMFTKCKRNIYTTLSFCLRFVCFFLFFCHTTKHIYTQSFVGHGIAPSCDIFNRGSSYFHVPLTTVRHLLMSHVINGLLGEFLVVPRKGAVGGGIYPILLCAMDASNSTQQRRHQPINQSEALISVEQNETDVYNVRSRIKTNSTSM